MIFRGVVGAATLVLGFCLGAADIRAQSAASGPPNALQGFSQNRDKPIQIDAARLEVRDKDKVATFFGDAKAAVKVIQGDTTLRSKTLVVHYDQDDAKANAKGGPSATASRACSNPAAAPAPAVARSRARAESP